jgi:hypothetical protein
MRTALYILILLVVAVYLFMPDIFGDGRSRFSKWFLPAPPAPVTPRVSGQSSSDSVQPVHNIRPGKVPAAELACPSGWVYVDGQCQYRYSPPWKWPGYNRPI